MKEYTSLNQNLKELEKEINLLDGPLKSWNLNYFKEHKKRFSNEVQLVKNLHSKGKILEIGSIPYHLTFLLEKEGYNVTGIDVEPGRFKGFIKKHSLKVQKCNIETEDLPFQSSSFNLILFAEVFEHLRVDPLFTLKEINRVLSKKGVLILTTPNLYSFSTILSFLIGRGFNNAYFEFEKLHRLGHMGHIRVYSSKEMREFLERTGFKIITVQYKSYYNRPLLQFLSYFLPSSLRSTQILICKKS